MSKKIEFFRKRHLKCPVGNTERRQQGFFYLRNAGLRAVRVDGVGATSLRKRTEYLFLYIVFISWGGIPDASQGSFTSV